MKPVIVQTLIKKMQDRIRFPEPPGAEEQEPKRRDRTTQILLTIVIIAVIFSLLA